MNILNQKELIKYKGIWHSIKKEHLNCIFNNNYLEARTTQRYWPNGIVYRDNDREKYENSYFIKGWSMTRDRNYAFLWSCVTLLFDWDLIKRDFKIKTMSWNYRSQHCNINYDKEREEFVISNFLNQTIEEIKKEYFNIIDNLYDEKGVKAVKLWQQENGSDYIDYWQRKGNKIINFEKYLLGIFISKESYEIYKGKGFELALNHPLFKGFISSEHANKHHSSSMKKFKYNLN